MKNWKSQFFIVIGIWGSSYVAYSHIYPLKGGSTSSSNPVDLTSAVSGVLPVANGGTNFATVTQNGVLYGNAASTILAVPQMGNGGLVIGTGGNPSTGTLTGTAALTVTNAAGTITVGVNSSSVPIKVSNLIVNSEIDSSSITKLANGLVPNYLVDATSITKLGQSVALGGTQVNGTLTVSNGGTGATTFTNGGILFGGGTGAITASAVLTNGQLLIGDGTTAPTIGTLTGTANQVTVTNGVGTITLATPQNIDTAATPTFGGETVTGQLTVSNSTTTLGGAVGIGAVGLTGGSVVIRSTSTTATHPALQIQNNSGTELARLQQNGRLGVGLNNPANIIHASGSGLDGQIRVDNTLNTSSARLILVNDVGTSSELAMFGSGNSSRGGWSQNGTERVTVTNGGLVGISATSPSYDFDVTGGERVTGQRITAGTATFAGAGISALGPLSMGPVGGTAGGHRSPLTVWATSIDGASQSSGCAVALAISVDSDAGLLQFTSTTTANTAGAIGVLFDNTCAAGAVCRVAYSGVVRVLVNGSATVGGPLGTSSTRCQAQNGSQAQGTAANGRILSAGSGAGSWVWAVLGMN